MENSYNEIVDNIQLDNVNHMSHIFPYQFTHSGFSIILIYHRELRQNVNLLQKEGEELRYAHDNYQCYRAFMDAVKHEPLKDRFSVLEDIRNNDREMLYRNQIE